MTDNQFDNSFKNILGGYNSPVPEGLWERIIQKKDKDRKGFIFFFKLFGIGLLPVAQWVVVPILSLGWGCRRKAVA